VRHPDHGLGRQLAQCHRAFGVLDPGNHAWPNGAAGSVPRISSGSQVATGMSCHGSRSDTGNPMLRRRSLSSSMIGP
jgi:hypothetical protein